MSLIIIYILKLHTDLRYLRIMIFKPHPPPQKKKKKKKKKRASESKSILTDSASIPPGVALYIQHPPFRHRVWGCGTKWNSFH